MTCCAAWRGISSGRHRSYRWVYGTEYVEMTRRMCDAAEKESQFVENNGQGLSEMSRLKSFFRVMSK